MPSSKDLTQEQTFKLEVHKLDIKSKLIGLAIKGLTAVGIVWQLKIAIIAAAGKNTNFLVNVLGNLTISQTIAWTGCMSGVGIATIQQRLMNKHKNRIEKLEAELLSCQKDKKTSARSR